MHIMESIFTDAIVEVQTGSQPESSFNQRVENFVLGCDPNHSTTKPGRSIFENSVY